MLTPTTQCSPPPNAHPHHPMLTHRHQQSPPKLPPPPPPATHSQEVGKGGNHLLFTPVTPADQSHDIPATGPRYVLGALRRPEFDLILKLSQRRARQQKVVHESEDEAELDYRTYVSGQRDSSGDDDDEFTDTDDNRTGTTRGAGGRGARWSSPSSSYTGRVGMIAHERSVWFADEEDDDEEAPFTEELPRLVPRPYWRNKSPVSRVTSVDGQETDRGASDDDVDDVQKTAL
ncbi:hypothetical protein Pcinc_027933 [Petrolisthes cinctipes]|uniref:Uncharacterized protein n=1 Tax=Petrolisthes cinctipes TaxID=88211 RepID=A0AAE1F3F6_PETCI|nr:hypothetical protein Pcinc_027933 [Petrolisthes cinctipes]